MIVSSIIASVERADDPLQMALEQDHGDMQMTSSLSLDDISEETIYKRGQLSMLVGSLPVLSLCLYRRIQDGPSAGFGLTSRKRSQADCRQGRGCNFGSAESAGGGV